MTEKVGRGFGDIKLGFRFDPDVLAGSAPEEQDVERNILAAELHRQLAGEWEIGERKLSSNAFCFRFLLAATSHRVFEQNLKNFGPNVCRRGNQLGQLIAHPVPQSER